MNFNEYQKRASDTAIYREATQMHLPRLGYVVTGLASEAGEICGEYKRIVRDDGCIVTDQRILRIAEEIGDVMWYCAMLATEMGCDLDQIAEDNLAKLRERKTTGKLKGRGER